MPKKKKKAEPLFIYVVMGQCGEYSDHREWTVLGFFDKDAADKHEWACKLEATRIQELIAADNEKYWDDTNAKPYKHRLDSAHQPSSYGADYYVMAVPVSGGDKLRMELANALAANAEFHKWREKMELRIALLEITLRTDPTHGHPSGKSCGTPHCDQVWRMLNADKEKEG